MNTSRSERFLKLIIDMFLDIDRLLLGLDPSAGRAGESVHEERGQQHKQKAGPAFTAAAKPRP